MHKRLCNSPSGFFDVRFYCLRRPERIRGPANFSKLKHFGCRLLMRVLDFIVEEKSAMKPHRFPIARLDRASLFPMLVWNPLCLLLCALTLSGTTLLTAAPARAQTLYRPLTFEQNQGLAPKEVKWLGHNSSDRALFVGGGATFLHRDEYEKRAMPEALPAPAGRGSNHDLQAAPKSRRPQQKPDLLERTTPPGRRHSSEPQTSSDRVIPSASQLHGN
jgi:hypothetical protein